jgi:hypothetical protein
MRLSRCSYCNEALEAGMGGPKLHHECQFRMVAGSVAHIEKRCSCFVQGSQEGDPPGMGLREAAQAARGAWLRVHKGDADLCLD